MKRYNLKKLAFASAVFASAFLPVTAVFAEGEGDPSHTPFDGKAYFVWECNGGKPCYHLFTNLKTPEQGINYIQDTEITDDSGNGVNYVFKQKNADWVLPGDFASVSSSSNYEDYIGDEDKQTHGVTIQAIAFGGGANSIATNEDWNFQVIIYRDGYKAVTVGDNANDYTYFPATWDFNYNYYIDVSDTTASSPAIVTSYLKEPTVKIKSEGILSMTPLNVNTSAVTVSKSLEGFDVKFNSSYYDHVTFELKSSDGKTYYLMIARTSLTIKDNFGPSTTASEAKAIAHVMFPTGSADENTYSIIATVVSKDGTKTTSTIKSEPAENIYGFGGNEAAQPTIECGKGLTCAQYSVKTGNPRALAGIYFNVIKNGSSNTVYSGTFSGSNLGTYWNAESRKVTYD
ncbi:hypothetical protein IKG48_02655 [Candidatus Saccharibacteria bacterium]|nr:hypothetical protein [Candidatus Saccharibacteria bacterium]